MGRPARAARGRRRRAGGGVSPDGAGGTLGDGAGGRDRPGAGPGLEGRGAGPAGVGPDGTVVIARAHHGSVSRVERSEIEEALKAGRLPAVVATSSLELGIDMGAVDLVIQVESPPSVASGLQRVGRAGHNVGDVSRGVIFPKYAGDLIQASVVAERMQERAIEELRIPRNPLDVLAQQVVAMAALDDWAVDELEAVVRRAAPFSGLTRPVLEAVLDMLAGRYPGEEFAGLKPRVVWDRVAGVIHGRPGAQRLAVTSGGTIPDRGYFGVFLASGDVSGRGVADEAGGTITVRGAGARQPKRVGELDEEMVYESRVGDVFVLGASSWRIEDITPDRVLVLPAPGQPGKLPFWHGDTPGRPAELGKAIGAKVRELAALPEAKAVASLRAGGLDELAARNLVRYLAEQRQATGHVPDDRTLVLERFRDELGRLAGGAALPLRRPGARAVGARHLRPAARALRRDGRAGAAHRRRDHHPGARLRRAAAGRGRAARPGRDRRDHHRRGRRQRAVRVPVPRVRGPGAAAPPAAAGAAHPALAAAAAVGASCSRSRRSSPGSRSRWRPSGSACRTCSTCRR